MQSKYKCIIRNKDSKNMTTDKCIKKTPRHGFINDIARACGCSRHTVRTAIYDNAAGEKADKVRKYYKARYKEIVVR